jgi:hypothetical protein
VVNQFTALGSDPRVAFLGNVTVGRDVQLPELRAFYNAVPPGAAGGMHVPDQLCRPHIC